MFSVVSFVGVFVCLFVCQRENSLTVSDINMKFLLEQARTSSKIAAFRCTAAREFLSSSINGRYFCDYKTLWVLFIIVHCLLGVGLIIYVIPGFRRPYA